MSLANDTATPAQTQASLRPSDNWLALGVKTIPMIDHSTQRTGT